MLDQLGMASALHTLCGQAYGARQYRLLGIYKQRAMVILTMTSVPLSIVWFYTEPILARLGQDADISAEAGTFARWMIPSLFAYGLLQCHVRFLQTQNVVVPVMASSGAAAACHLVVCWVLVYGLGLGSRGAALSSAVANWVNVAVLAAYVRVSGTCRATWTGFSAEAFRDVLGFVRLAIPSALMVWYVRAGFFSTIYIYSIDRGTVRALCLTPFLLLIEVVTCMDNLQPGDVVV
jgi:multidrug resistance protein, MATE family